MKIAGKGETGSLVIISVEIGGRNVMIMMNEPFCPLECFAWVPGAVDEAGSGRDALYYYQLAIGLASSIVAMAVVLRIRGDRDKISRLVGEKSKMKAGLRSRDSRISHLNSHAKRMATEVSNLEKIACTQATAMQHKDSKIESLKQEIESWNETCEMDQKYFKIELSKKSEHELALRQQLIQEVDRLKMERNKYKANMVENLHNLRTARAYLQKVEVKFKDMEAKHRDLLMDIHEGRVGSRPAEREGASRGSCVICHSNEANIALIPCGHLCLCASCLPEFVRRQAVCAVCCGDYESTLKVFRC